MSIHVKRPGKAAVLTVLVLASAITIAASEDDVFFLIKKNFAIFAEVYNEVNALYVDPLDPQSMMRTGIDAMLETLDPYTVVIDESRNAEMEIMTRGSYGGVGMEVDFRNGQIIVIAPMDGTSAAKKGVRAGDIIIGINGIDASEMLPEEVESLMIGEIGTSVLVKIRRLGLDKPLEFDLTREKIEINNVSYSGALEDSAFIYLALERFGQDAAMEVKNAISLHYSVKTKGIVLDMRNNPGGLLNEAVDLVGLFVEGNVEIARTKGRIQENNQVYRSRGKAPFLAVPLVILQNRGSASASEVVAGAIQDLDRGVIIGERSYGKGLVQIVKPLSYNLALKVTTAKYFIPSGRSIQAIDYTHLKRKAARMVADSSRKPFKTKAGRVVYDGAGIEPDMVWSEPEKSFAQMALLRESRYIFFTGDLLAASKSKNTADITDEQLFGRFQTYLAQSGFRLELESESELSYLENVLKKEAHPAAAIQALSVLKKEVEQFKSTVLEKEKKAILDELRLEIAGQAGGQGARAQLAVLLDPMVKEAIALLKKPDVYNAMLQAKK